MCARTTGPLLSLDARGSIGGSLTFSGWKGRSYVRRLVTPANPKSNAQTGVRSMMKFLSQAWADLSAPNKATWEDLAAQINASPFNAYVKYNLKNWRDFLTPSHAYPAERAGEVDNPGTPVCTLQGRTILVTSVVPSSIGDNWGAIIFRSPTGTFTASWNNAIGVVVALSGATVTYYDGPLDPGTYYYQLGGFTDEGTYGNSGNEDSETVV
jgi:hypothetical protein